MSTQLPTGNCEPIDLNILKGFSDGDWEIEKNLVAIFVRQTDDNIKTLYTNRAHIGSVAWSETAHVLKGSSSSMGADELARLSDIAQKFSGTAQEQTALFDRINNEYLSIKDYLRKKDYL